MRPGVWFLVLSGVLVACGGSSSSVGSSTSSGGSSGVDADGGGGSSGGGSSSGSSGGSSSGGSSSGSSGSSGTTPDGGGSSGNPGVDGPPSRVACTSNFGNALSVTHGRLDGVLVAVVPTTQHSCNSDSSHLHLQVSVSGSTYDVAVNLDAMTQEVDAPLPDGAWAEGWHNTMALDYVSNLNLHSGTFTAGTPDSIQSHLMAALASVNHISVFATGYGPGGAHLVHRQGFGRDGAVFIEPLGATAHGFVFHFNTQTF